LPIDTDLPAKPIAKEEMDQLKARPYTWPFDVKDKWADADAMRLVGDRFLAKWASMVEKGESVTFADHRLWGYLSQILW
jgi:hypothetical protein